MQTNFKPTYMKKLVLLSALTIGALSANADNFTDFFKVTYENKEIQSGETIACETTDADKSRYECDYFVEPLMEPELLSLSYRAVYLDSPTYEESLANRAMWGTPTICYVMGPNANCIPGQGNIISQYTFEQMTGTLEIQMHLDGEIDLSTFSFKLPEKAGTYRVVLTGTYDGAEIEDDFITDIYIGPGAAGVEGVIDDVNAPTEYFDLTGRKVLNPAKGQIVIVRQGSKAVKAIF